MTTRPLVFRDVDLPWEGWDESQTETRGNVIWKTLFSQGKTESEALTVGVAVVPPGGALSPHRHAQPEIYYILAGEGVMELEDQRYSVSAGTAIFIPGNAKHGIANPNVTDVRFLYAFAADSFEDVIYLFENEQV